jgi:hypothetical protein
VPVKGAPRVASFEGPVLEVPVPRTAAVALLALSLCVARPADATPVVITLEGQVTNVSDHDGIAAAAGLSLGAPVSFTILFDVDEDGFYLEDGGTVPVVDESDADGSIDRFYAERLAGDDVGYGYHPEQVERTYYSGQNETIFVPFEEDGTLTVGAGISFGAGSHVDDWTVGTSIFGNEVFANATGSGFVQYQTTITAIEIPEPAPGALLASALWLARRRRRR